MPKINVKSERASNKSCSELNCVRKSPRAHMSISPRSGARGLEKLIWLKYNIILKRENTFALGLNAAKICITYKKASDKGCLELNFVQKSLRAHISISHQIRAFKGSKD